MANPLTNEKEIYEKIEKEGLRIPQEIQELLNHHLRNDTQVIMFGAADLRHCLIELIQTLTALQSKQKPISADDLAGALQELVTICDSVLIRSHCIRRLLVKLHEATHQESLVGLKTKAGHE
jgi:hypothetical protein